MQTFIDKLKPENFKSKMKLLEIKTGFKLLNITNKIAEFKNPKTACKLIIEKP